MFALKKGAGKVEMPGRGIRLTKNSTQAQFASALKHVPGLRKKHIVELSDEEYKKRFPTDEKKMKNDSKKEGQKEKAE